MFLARESRAYARFWGAITGGYITHAPSHSRKLILDVAVSYSRRYIRLTMISQSSIILAAQYTAVYAVDV